MTRNVGSSFCVGHNNEALVLLIIYQYIRRKTRLDSQNPKVTPEWQWRPYCCNVSCIVVISMMTYVGKTTCEAAGPAPGSGRAVLVSDSCQIPILIFGKSANQNAERKLLVSATRFSF